MKVRCDRNELSECLGDILGIVGAAQTTKPIFQDFHLKTEDTFLIVEVTDLDMGAKVRLERVEVEEGGEIALPATRFYSVLREVPERSVILETLSDGADGAGARG